MYSDSFIMFPNSFFNILLYNQVNIFQNPIIVFSNDYTSIYSAFCFILLVYFIMHNNVHLSIVTFINPSLPQYLPKLLDLN